MLTVDVEKRITVDECLSHPWITQEYINPADSTDGLTGAMGQLDFSKRKMQRERTLLSSINDVKISRVIDPGSDGEASGAKVKVFEKNPDGKKRVHNRPAKQPANANANGKKGGKKHEETPAANRAENEFMEMGGKGDQVLFADDESSRYVADEVPDGGK